MGAEVFDQHLLLAAKAAADTRFHHADTAYRQAEQGSNHAPYMERNLCTCANYQPVIFVPVGDGNVRLDACLLYLMHIIFALEDKIGGVQRAVHIVMVNEQLDRDVAFGVVDHLRIGFIVNHGRACLQRLFGRKNGGQLFVFDLDSFQRLLHELRRFRGYCRHPVANVAYFRVQADLVVGGRLRVTLTAAGVDDARQVGVGLHGVNARQRQRGRRVDREDAGVGYRTGEQAAVEHTR